MQHGFSEKKRLNTHSVNAGTYRSDGPLSIKKHKEKGTLFYFMEHDKLKSRATRFLPSDAAFFNCTTRIKKVLLFAGHFMGRFHADDKYEDGRNDKNSEDGGYGYTPENNTAETAIQL